MTSQEIKQSLQNPATSYWLLRAMDAMDGRDVLDAARDADILLLYCKARLNETEASYTQAI